MGGARHDLHADRRQTGDTAFQHVAGHDGCHASGRARKNQVAGLQSPGGRQLLDGLCNVPDQLANLAALARLAIHVQGDVGIGNVGHLGRRHQAADRGRVLKALANTPGAALLLHLVLQVAPRHVQADRIAVNMRGRIGGADLRTAHANGHDQLNFVVQIGGQRGVGHQCRGTRRGMQHGIGRLLKEKGRLTAACAHFPRMFFVVAAHAVDAVYGKACLGSLHWNRNGRRRRKHIGHGQHPGG